MVWLERQCGDGGADLPARRPPPAQMTVTSVPGAAWARSMTHSEIIARSVGHGRVWRVKAKRIVQGFDGRQHRQRLAAEFAGVVRYLDGQQGGPATTVGSGHGRARHRVERAIAGLKTWRILFTDYRRALETLRSAFRGAQPLACTSSNWILHKLP